MHLLAKTTCKQSSWCESGHDLKVGAETCELLQAASLAKEASPKSEVSPNCCKTKTERDTGRYLVDECELQLLGKVTSSVEENYETRNRLNFWSHSNSQCDERERLLHSPALVEKVQTQK